VRDEIGPTLSDEQERLWKIKLEEAEKQNKEIGKSFQYGLSARDAKETIPRDSYEQFGKGRYKLIVPVSVIDYSRIELAMHLKSRYIPNVLAVSEIMKGKECYLFVTRGGRVAYYDSPEQLHALVAGGFPRNIKPIMPADMTIDRWLEEQQMTEHAIRKEEVMYRIILGVVLDKTNGYKPDILVTGFSSLDKQQLNARAPQDAFERDRVVQVEATEAGLTGLLLEHMPLGKNVPVGLAGGILELGRVYGLRAIDNLLSEAKLHGAPPFEHEVKR